jgi:ferrochelatase
VHVICPGFSADCLETLEEIAMENRATFLAAGGAEYRYIPCLNDRSDHINLLAGLVAQHVQGWVLPVSGAARDAELAERKSRALAVGATV